MTRANVYESVEEYLDPRICGPTSLVRIHSSLNPYEKEGVVIYAKAMYEKGSVKYAPMWDLIEYESRSSGWPEVHTVVEGTSGNAGASLAVLCNLRGKAFVPVVPADLAPGKQLMLDIYGANTPIKTSEVGEDTGIKVARKLGSKKGFYNPGQYDNELNPGVYESVIAPEIWEQTTHRIGFFSAALGTTGTLVGCRRFFKRHPDAHVQTVGAVCAAATEHQSAGAIPGARTVTRLADIGFEWGESADFIKEVTTKQAFLTSLRLIRTGIPGGPTSGAALIALHSALASFLEIFRNDPAEIDSYRDGAGEIIAVFICADSFLPYMDKYSTHLDPVDMAPMCVSPR